MPEQYLRLITEGAYILLFVPARVKVRLVEQLAFLKVGYDTQQEDGSPQNV